MSPDRSDRFVVLDSWRGICAILVALFHFRSVSHIYQLRFFRGAYLFVDFFFVLSGFVIFASYQNKLKQGFGVGRFLLLRFGRVYPLHFAVLMGFIGFDLVRLAVPSLAGYSAFRPFTAPGETPACIVSNLLLIHSLGVHDHLSFNGASWSISVEFYTYVFFGLALVFLKDRIKWLLIALLILSPLFLANFSPHYMDTSYHFGFIRCLFGFSAGALCWLLFDRWSALADAMPAGRYTWDGLEIGIVALIIVFVTVAGTGALTLAAPLLFSASILVFAKERGAVSHLLKTPFFVLLGTLSYSIYMDHMFISEKLFFGGAKAARKLFHVVLTTTVDGQEQMGTSPVQGDLVSLTYLAVLTGVAYITFRIIEEPSRSWFRSLAYKGRGQGVTASPETEPAAP